MNDDRPRFALRFVSGKYQGGEFPLRMNREIIVGRSSDLDMVLGRLAPGAYDLIYADVAPAEVAAFRERAWPLLSDGGVLIFAGVLLDGTIADESRRDRDTVAAREAEQHLLEREDALVTRMPIGAGAIALIKK